MCYYHYYYVLRITIISIFILMHAQAKLARPSAFAAAGDDTMWTRMYIIYIYIHIYVCIVSHIHISVCVR